jgi:hypothetical protein
VVSFTPRPLYPRGKGPLYPLDRRLGGPQSRSGRHGEEKIRDPTGTRIPTPRSSSPLPVAISTELSRLLGVCRVVDLIFSEPKYGSDRPSDRSLSAELVPTLADRGCRVVIATDPHGRNLGFLDPEPPLFHSSSSSIILTRLSGTRSRTTTSQKIW